MADIGDGRGPVRLAQVLLVVGAVALWAASRMPWVVVSSFDGLGQPRRVVVSGAAWSTALLPLAVLSLAAAVAAVAVHGWPLRVLSVLTAAASLAAGYLAVSMWVITDVAARGAEIADVPVVSLVGSERHYVGAAITCAAALCIVCGAALLMRSASAGGGAAGGVRAAKYAAPAARRSAVRRDATASAAPDMSERMIWDALDEGRDPTDGPPGADAEGR